MDPKIHRRDFEAFGEAKRAPHGSKNINVRGIAPTEGQRKMLMRKFYEIMSAHGKFKKNDGCGKVSDDGEIGSSAALASTTNDEEC